MIPNDDQVTCNVIEDGIFDVELCHQTMTADGEPIQLDDNVTQGQINVAVDFPTLQFSNETEPSFRTLLHQRLHEKLTPIAQDLSARINSSISTCNELSKKTEEMSKTVTDTIAFIEDIRSQVPSKVNSTCLTKWCSCEV